MMGKRLINGENSESQRTTRKLQQLLVIFALLLMPSLAWGQATITVAGHEPDNEGNITGTGITGTVTYDATNKILTLEGATITLGIESSLDNLTIKLAGTNEVNTAAFGGNSGASYAIYSSNPSATLTIVRKVAKANTELILNAKQYNPVIKGFASVSYGEGDYQTYLSSPYVPARYDNSDKEMKSFGSPGDDITNASITSEVTYPIWVSGTQFTQITHQNLGSGTYTYLENENTLQLSGIDLEAADRYTICSDVASLKVKLVGTNTIQTSHPFYSFYNGDATISFTTDSSDPGTLSLPRYSNDSEYDVITGFKNSANPTVENGLVWQPTTSGEHIVSATISTLNYGLTVAGVAVTSANKDDILNDGGTVKFTPSTNYNASEESTWHKLTLNGANISYDGNVIVRTSTESLTVDLVGKNTINCGSYGAFEGPGGSNNSTDLTLTTSTTSPGSLTMTSTSDNFDTYSFSIGFRAAIFENPLIATDFSNGSTKEVVLSVDLGLSIAGINVSSANYNADGTITGLTDIKYIRADNTTTPITPATLTLDNVTLTNTITWRDDADLIVELIGNNSITTTGTSCITSTNTSKKISFTRGDANNTCSLELDAGSTYVIMGFSNYDAPTVTDMFWVPTKDLYGKIISATITTSLLGGGAGTESDPLVISSFDDLKKFSNYVNCGALTTQYVKLADNLENNTLDCSGGTGFEPIGPTYIPFIGTFDGNNKTISGLTYNASGSGSDNYSALFGFIGDDTHQGTVKNLTLKNCSFTGAGDIGGIAAILKDGTIENCTVDKCTLTSGNQQLLYVGGIVGEIYKGAISGCKVNGGTITGSSTYDSEACTSRIGGIAGYLLSNSNTNISSCEVTGVTIYSTLKNSDLYHLGGIVGVFDGTGTFSISNNTVKGTTNLNCVDNGTDPDIMHVGAIVGDKGSATYNGNTYESTVTTSKKLGTNDAIVLSGQEERGIGYYNDGTNLKSDFDIIDQVMLAGTKKVTITKPANQNGGFEITSGYLISDDGSVIYALPDSVVTVKFYSPSVGYKPRLTLNDENIQVTPTDKFDNKGNYDCTEFSWTMPNADKTATLTYPIDLAANDITATIDDANYTGEAIVPGTVKAKGGLLGTTDVELTKDTHFTINSYMLNNSFVNSPVDIGTYTVTIEGIGDYIGTKEVSYEIVKAYALKINGTQFNVKNADDFYKNGTVKFTPATDTNPTNVLTLNNVSVTGAIESGLGDLTIHLTGDNNIVAAGSETSLIKSTNNGTLTFETDDVAVGNLKFKDSNDAPFGNAPFSGFAEVEYGAGLDYYETNTTKEVGLTYYNLKVGGVDVTSVNKRDVFADGKVTYDSKNYILTLKDGVDITGSIWYLGNGDLIIKFDGTVNVNNSNGGTYGIYSEGPSLTFVKAEGATKAELTATSGAGGTAISTYSLGSGLYEKPMSETSTVITDDPEFIIIENYVMTDDRSIGAAGAEITYDSTEKILTFNNYGGALNSQIKTGVQGLTIKLKGRSPVAATSLDYPFKAMTNTATILFDGSDGGELDIKTNQTDGLFVGFADGAITYNKVAYWYDSSESNQVHRIEAPTAPTMEMDFNENVKLTKPYADGTIYYSIDYADDSEDLENATYSAPFAMATPGTVTAWVEANNATTSTVTGKHFAYQDAPYTMAIGGTQTITAIIPAIDEGDGIKVVENPSIPDNAIATLSEGVITAVGAGNTTLSTRLGEIAGATSTIFILNYDKKVTADIYVGEPLNNYFEGSNEFCTFYNETADIYAVPQGMKAYVVTGVNGNKLVIEETTVLPPNTVVLLDKAEGIAFTKVPAEGAAPAGNLLTRAASNVAVTSTSLFYVLFNDTFVKATAGSPIPSGKNYLDLSSYLVAVNGVNARGFYEIGDGDTTGMDATLMDNGQLIMDNYFDLQGRKIQKPTKPGLYIRNGKKVVVSSK